jgi:hypothetical protein
MKLRWAKKRWVLAALLMVCFLCYTVWDMKRGTGITSWFKSFLPSRTPELEGEQKPPTGPPYITPKDAVLGLIEAYRSMNVEQIVQSKDFEMDSRLFWEGLGLPVSEKQLRESQSAFETNFRTQMKEKIPDYRAVRFRVVSEERLQENFAILTVSGSAPGKKKAELKIPVFKTNQGWKVVLHPQYDYL